MTGPRFTSHSGVCEVCSDAWLNMFEVLTGGTVTTLEYEAEGLADGDGEPVVVRSEQVDIE
jgi:hypothetical protein